jgi:hypothetical protein
MDLDGDATTIVDDADGVVRMNDHLDVIAISRQCFVDCVVDDFKHHVMQAGSIAGIADVHTGALANRFQPLEDLDAVGVVVGCALLHGSLAHWT